LVVPVVILQKDADVIENIFSFFFGRGEFKFLEEGFQLLE
jgi:hypothetical protein